MHKYCYSVNIITTFSLFYNGKFVTHEVLSEKKFEKIIAEKMI